MSLVNDISDVLSNGAMPLFDLVDALKQRRGINQDLHYKSATTHPAKAAADAAWARDTTAHRTEVEQHGLGMQSILGALEYSGRFSRQYVSGYRQKCGRFARPQCLWANAEVAL